MANPQPTTEGVARFREVRQSRLVAALIAAEVSVRTTVGPVTFRRLADRMGIHRATLYRNRELRRLAVMARERWMQGLPPQGSRHST